MPSPQAEWSAVESLQHQLVSRWNGEVSVPLLSPDDPASGLSFRVNGQEIVLRFARARHPMAEFVGVMSPAVSALQRDELELLLELSFITSVDGACVAIDPAAGCALLLVRQPVADLDADAVWAVMSSMARLMSDWRSHAGAWHPARRGDGLSMV